MVLVLSDGVVGHDRASEGVLAALSRHHARVDDKWLGVRELRPRSRRVARSLAALTLPARWLATGAATDPDRLGQEWADKALDDWPKQADIVLSTGPATAAANIASGRMLGARSIYCGFPKWPVLGFSLVLSPRASRHPRVLECPRPTVIDALTLPTPRSLSEPGPRQIALLFGGETKHYAYSQADMEDLAGRCSDLLTGQPQWELALYDSRRTAPALFETLVQRLDAFGDRVSVRRFMAGTNSNSEAFRADLVMVTADSLSMITEAVAAARPTLVVGADTYAGPRRDRSELDDMTSRGLIARSKFCDIAPATLRAVTVPPRVSRPAELSRLLQARGF